MKLQIWPVLPDGDISIQTNLEFPKFKLAFDFNTI